MVGIGLSTIALNGAAGLDTANAYAQQSNGFLHRSTVTGGYGSLWTVGDVIGIALDLETNLTVDFYKNGVGMGVPGISALSGTYYPAIALYANSALDLRTGAGELQYIPAGYSAWG
jgi:hypothetical protein